MASRARGQSLRRERARTSPSPPFPDFSFPILFSQKSTSVKSANSTGPARALDLRKSQLGLGTLLTPYRLYLEVYSIQYQNVVVQ